MVALALTSLSHIFNVSESDLRHELVASKVLKWGADPFARGAYSYYTPETPAAIRTLLEPVAGRLFFAGEALYAGETSGVVGGTVEAALASGLASAKAILKQ